MWTAEARELKFQVLYIILCLIEPSHNLHFTQEGKPRAKIKRLIQGHFVASGKFRAVDSCGLMIWAELKGLWPFPPKALFKISKFALV